MVVILSTLFTITAAGLLAGAGLFTFMAAAFGAAFATWLLRRPPAPAEHLFATLDPATPDSAMLLAAMRQALQRVQQTKHTVLVRVSAFRVSEHPKIRLRLTRDGDLEIACDGKRARALKQPGVWIADHPLPLTLPHAHTLTLRIEAAAGGRVRVAPVTVWPPSRRFWGIVALCMVTACALGTAAPLAAALGCGVQAYLLVYHAHRTHGNL